MAGEWIECRLADACASIDYGLTESAADHQAGPKFLRITDIVSGYINWGTVPHVAADEETAAKYQLRDGDIVLARTGASTGVSVYVRNPPQAVFASYLVRLQAKPEFDPRFLAYYLKSEQFWTFIRGVLGDKSAQPNASASTMTKAPLRAPKDKAEQRAIAHILGTLDDKIELNRRMNETLEAIAHAIFKSWFVDAVKEELPQGWRESRIGDEVRVAGGSTPSTENPEFWEGGTFHWATPKDLATLTSPVLLDTERQITAAGLEQISSGLLPVGTVLLSSRAPIGYLAISEIPVAVNQGFITMVCDKTLPNRYVCLWAKQNMEAIEANANGTTFLEISKRNFRPLPVFVPPKPVLDEFIRRVEPLYWRVVSNLQESHTLAAIRDALLPKLLLGEVKVENVERATAATHRK